MFAILPLMTKQALSEIGLRSPKVLPQALPSPSSEVAYCLPSREGSIAVKNDVEWTRLSVQTLRRGSLRGNSKDSHDTVGTPGDNSWVEKT